MRRTFHRSIRRFAIAVSMLACATPVFADVPPPDPNSGLPGLIFYWIRLILHGEWGQLFSSLGGMVVFLGVIAGIAVIFTWMLKPVEKLVEKERKKEEERRLREGIVTLPGGKSTFPTNAVLLVRGIKAALNPNTESQKSASAASVPSGTPSLAATKPSPAAGAPTPRPVTSTGAPSSTPKAAGSAPKTATPTAPVAPAQTPAPATKQTARASQESQTSHAIAPSAAKKSVFISYRRQDSPHITGRIYDRLAARFGRDAVFKDVDDTPLGLDFREHLHQQTGRCEVFVAVIGKNWNPPSVSGGSRLSDPGDHLRIEIEAALGRGIPLIPVLVDGASMPAERDLPDSIELLAYRNGIQVRQDPDFHHDIDRLIRGIEQLLK
jgi:TIR domain